jgi:uncharacterized protein (TIGR02246 family)
MQWLLGVGLVAGLVLGAPANAQDKAEIEAFYREWMGAAMTKGADAYAGYYAADGRLLPPNAPPVIGREAIAVWFRQSQSSAPYTTKPEGITVDEIRFLTPGWAIHRSTLRGQRIPKDGGAAKPFETKYFDLLHRTDSGRWEIVSRMWSDNGQ